MKKLALVAAIAATISVGANATTYTISSTLTDSQLILSSDDQIDEAIVFGGTIEINTTGGVGDAWTVAGDQLGARVTLSGNQSIATGVTVLNYFLDGVSSSAGINFNSGTIDIEAGGAPYDVVDATVDNLHFDSAGTWQTLPIGGIDMSGGTVEADETIFIAFNGLWTGPQPLGYFDGPAAALQATGTATLFGNAALIYLEGGLTLTRVAAVPVPAAAWLFGSALLGLAGLSGRKRRV